MYEGTRVHHYVYVYSTAAHVALVSDLGNCIAGAPNSYALRTARDSENFHAGAAAQILFMEPDTACDFHAAPAPCVRDAHTGLRDHIVGLLTA